jgi:hypothetical protein
MQNINACEQVIDTCFYCFLDEQEFSTESRDDVLLYTDQGSPRNPTNLMSGTKGRTHAANLHKIRICPSTNNPTQKHPSLVLHQSATTAHNTSNGNSTSSCPPSKVPGQQFVVKISKFLLAYLSIHPFKKPNQPK